MAMATPGCRLYLVTPAALDPMRFRDALTQALDAGDVACVQLRLKDADDDDLRRACDRLRPVAQARDMTVQKREGDLVVATFGRGFYVLDDYSPLRELAAQALTEEAHLYPLRDAYQFSQTGLAPAGTAGIGPMSGNWTAPNPPYGAVFTYSVNGGFGDDKLVLNITDDSGKQIRRLDLDKSPGLRRIAWNLRGETPPQNPADQGRGFGGGGGRGGNQAPPAAPGRYRATIARVAGDKVTPVGQGVSFSVLPIELK